MSASSLTPVSAARSRARVAAGYVGTFVAGISVAAIPLLSALKHIADNKEVILSVAELINRVGWPAFIAAVAVAWLHFERRSWRLERQMLLDDHARAMDQQMRHHRAELEMLGGELQEGLREIVGTLRKIESRIEELSGPVPLVRR